MAVSDSDPFGISIGRAVDRAITDAHADHIAQRDPHTDGCPYCEPVADSDAHCCAECESDDPSAVTDY